MKIGSSTSPKLTWFRSVFLVIVIILIWIVSSNSLFFSSKLNLIVDKISPQLGIREQTSLTEFSDIDEYIKDMVAGIVNPQKFPSVDIKLLVVDGVQDKGVSAGENSILNINKFDAKNVAVGLVSKDGSLLEVNEFIVSAVQLAISAYKKKPEYLSPSLIVKKAVNIDTKSQMQALVSNDSKIEIPNVFNILIEKSIAIESRMYGVEFGKATEK